MASSESAEHEPNRSNASRSIPPSIAPPIRMPAESFDLNSFEDVIGYLQTVKSEKYNQIAHDGIQQCHQCQQQIPRDSDVMHFTYLLPCLHTMCLACVNVFKTEKLICKICKQQSDKNQIPMLNQIVTPPGMCNAKRGCKNKTTGLCNMCHVMCCNDCYNESHEGHQRSKELAVTVACSKHPKVAAVYVCPCQAYLCRSCCNGYSKIHASHGELRPMPILSIVKQTESHQEVVKQRKSNVRVLYTGLIEKAQADCDKHFNDLKVEVTNKFFDFMNTVMNKFNDCCQEISYAEVEMGKRLEECGRQYAETTTKVYTFTNLCEDVANNFPSSVMQTFVNECYGRLEHEQAKLQKVVVDTHEKLLALPRIEFNTEQATKWLDQSVKTFGHRDLRAPVLTNPESKFFNLDMSEIMKNATKGSVLRKRNAGGPLAVSVTNAKKRREPETALASSAPPAALSTPPVVVPSAPSAPVYRYAPNVTMSNHSRVVNSVHTRGPHVIRPVNAGNQLPMHVQQAFAYQPPQQGFRMVTPRTVSRLSALGTPRPPNQWNLSNLNDISGANGPSFRPRTTAPFMYPPNTGHDNHQYPESEVMSSLPRRNVLQNRTDDGTPRGYSDPSMIPMMGVTANSANNLPRRSAALPILDTQDLNSAMRHFMNPSLSVTNVSSPSSLSQSSSSSEPLRGRAPPRILPMPSSSTPSQGLNQRRRQQSASRSGTANVTKASAEKQAELVAILANASADIRREEERCAVSRQVRVNSDPSPSTAPRSVPTVPSVPSSPNQPKSSGKLKMRIRLSQNNKPTQPTNEEQWDDYCAICNQGGDLICCDSCPKVYHNNCHIPNIRVTADKLPDDWQCNRCVSRVVVRKPSDTFNPIEREACAQVLMACYEDSTHSEPFERNVPKSFKDYYAVISHPICFKNIASKIEGYEYKTVPEFIADMNLVFANCVSFNPSGSPIEKSARYVYNLYLTAVRSQLKPFLDKVWCYSPKA
uniref:RING-type domain-containing protein n=3 Tax=Panagrellus redivivus TaxID=6233 RepID=A0A7E4W0P5_PANRE